MEASDNRVIGVSTNNGDSSKRCSLISKSLSSEGGVDDLSSQNRTGERRFGEGKPHEETNVIQYTVAPSESMVSKRVL